MKQKIKLGLTILAAAGTLGLAAPAFAQDTDPNASTLPPGGNWGQLGSAYTAAAFTYDHTTSSGVSDWRGFNVDLNEPLHAGLDFNLNYDWRQGENYLLRLTQQDLLGGVTAYAPLSWGKPFVQALAGWEWLRGYGYGADRSPDSFKYTVGAGVEFQVSSLVVVTPYVNFARATDFNRNEVDFGVKSSYRINRQWSVDGGLQYAAIHHAPDDSGLWVGLGYHY